MLIKLHRAAHREEVNWVPRSEVITDGTKGIYVRQQQHVDEIISNIGQQQQICETYTDMERPRKQLPDTVVNKGSCAVGSSDFDIFLEIQYASCVFGLALKS